MRMEVYSMYGGWSYLPDYPFKADLDRGEIFKLVDQPNDEVLINMRYVTPIEKDAKKYQCDNCGRKFIDSTTLRAHAKKSDCMDSQDGTSQGLRKSDVATMLDVDPTSVKIEDPPGYKVDSSEISLG